jgi:peptide/nickel transport system permease protein
VISVLGFTLFYAVLVVLGNLAADILYAFLDPRVRYT